MVVMEKLQFDRNLWREQLNEITFLFEILVDFLLDGCGLEDLGHFLNLLLFLLLSIMCQK